MKIKNFHDLATSEVRDVAMMLAETALQAIDTHDVMEKNFVLKEKTLFISGKYFPLEDIGRIFVVGVGKCSAEAVSVIEKTLLDIIADGIVLCASEEKFNKVRTYCGTHPFPTIANVEATSEIIKMLSGMTERDLVIFVISGGGSTLLCQPQSITCESEANILKKLFDAGATIEEINVLRKHISSARGGFLAKYAYPARVASLIFSDVPGDDIGLVASGPTVKDTTTINDAKKILEKYNLSNNALIEASLIETPKEDIYFQNVWNTVIISNKVALKAMEEKAKELGYTPIIKTNTLSGEARDIGAKIVEELHSAPSKTILLYGGEPTVTVKKPGKGGRGMELVLSASRTVGKGELVMSIASDGMDNSDFAGALCDIMTLEKAKGFGLSPEKYLEENMSYKFFEYAGDFLMTGSTGSNVSDLIVGIKI